MTLYHGPILTLAASHEQQRRLAAAEQSRLASNAHDANQVESARIETSRGIMGRVIAVVGWFASLTLVDRITQP